MSQLSSRAIRGVQAKGRSRLRLLSALLVPLLCLPGALPAQQGWKERDAWQRPADVMDALGIKAGSVVADVGAGEGYFTFHLAERVGPEGKVYAEDVDDKPLGKISERVAKDGLKQVETILGTPKNPRLPKNRLDAILVVNAYHEMHKYDAMLRRMYAALKPGGRLAIIDREDQPGKPRKTYFHDHRVPEELVRQDTARNGLRFLRKENDFVDGDKWFFLIFEKSRS